MKSIVLVITFSIISSFTFGQDCAILFIKKAGNVQVRVHSPETGECFKFYLDDKLITPNLTNELNFNINSEDYRINDTTVMIKAKIVMADGGEIKKRLVLPEGYKSHLFVIKKKKKGKYSLKRKLSGMVPSEELIAERKEKQEAFFDEKEKEREERDAKWEEESKARKDKAKAKKEAEGEYKGAQLSEYKDTIKGNKGREVVLIEGREENLIQGREENHIQGQNINVDNSTNNNQNGSFGQNTGSAFDDDEEEVDPFAREVNILIPNGETVKFSLQLLYNAEPIANTHLILEINDIQIGSGTTNENGLITITTNKPIDMNTAFRLTGKKGSYNWMFRGVQMLDFPPKTTKVEMAYIIDYVADQMGIAPVSLSESWGFIKE